MIYQSVCPRVSMNKVLIKKKKRGKIFKNTDNLKLLGKFGMCVDQRKVVELMAITAYLRLVTRNTCLMYFETPHRQF